MGRAFLSTVIFLLIFSLSAHSFKYRPRLTIIFVIDQCAYFYLPQLSAYFTGGFKKFLDRGVCFTNTYFPHGMPSTATGHAGLATGAYAKDHGIVGNGWFENDSYIHCDDDDLNSAVFSPRDIYAYGKSPKNIMVDTLSDSFVSSGACNNRYAFGVSLKSRSAIMTAGRLGKAIWFDNKSGHFTSSKAYFSAMPKWLIDFNRTQDYHNKKTMTWVPCFAEENKAYEMVNELSYTFARYDFKLIDKNIAPAFYENQKRPFDLWVKTPFANQTVLELSRKIIEEFVSKKNKNELLIWICLSSLDKLGHCYGPHSKEVIDMIYHLDRQLGYFMRDMQKRMGKNSVLFTLTSDHGIMPFVEILQNQGESARRIPIADLREDLNKKIESRFGIEGIISHFKVPQLYIDHKKLAVHDDHIKREILDYIKEEILTQPGIKNVWTFDELSQARFEQADIENFFKMQLYPARSGDIIIETEANNFLTKASFGTSHKDPYENNTHVPLMIYWSPLRKKVVDEKVWALQLPSTIAEFLKIKKPPSACELLPGIF